MRRSLLVIALVGCSSSRGEIAEPTAEPSSPPTANEPPSTPAPSESASAPAEAKPESEGGNEEEWKVEKGTADGVELSNDQGGSLKLKKLGWSSFLRKNKPLGDARVPSANVSFATVSADDVVVADVVCALPAWPDFPKDPATLAATMVPLVAKDSVPAASVAKVKTALLACASGKQLRLEWEFKDSKLVSAKAEGADAKTSACIKGALGKAFMMDSGVCAATLAP